MIDSILFLVFPALVIAAGVSDMLTMTIPNKLTLSFAALFVAAGFIVGLSPEAWGYHALAGVVVFVVCFTMFALGWMGGGDAKLASGIALWVGWSVPLIGFVLATGVLGAGLTLAVLFGRRQFPALPKFAQDWEWLVRLHDPKAGIPYGIALAAAAVYIYPETIWFKTWGW